MRLIFLLLIAFLLSSCVPNFYGGYYKPSYADKTAKDVLAYCGGQAGPPSGVTFELPSNVTVNVKTSKTYKSAEDDYRYEIILKAPSGVDLRFLSNTITLNYPDRQTLQENTTMRMHASGKVKIDTPLQFEQFCPVVKNSMTTLSESTFMSVEFWFKEEHNLTEKPASVEMVLPPIEYKDSVYPSSSIVMKAHSLGKNADYLTEAIESKKLHRYNECRRLTPHLSCKNILETMENKGFEKQVGDFDIFGRVNWRQWSTNNELNILLKIKTNVTEPWRVGAKNIRLKNLSDNSTITTDFIFGNVYCQNNSLPLSTPINNKETNSTVTLVIEGGIGSTPNKEVEILLPELFINKKVYKFKPIRLELRIFDVGIDPFNC